MRKRFEIQYELGCKPIDKIKIPLKSRDELPPVLMGLQHIYSDPKLNRAVFDLLEKRLFPSTKSRRTGRNGMSLWEILVLGAVRLALDANYDRIEHTANYDMLVRSLLGISSFGENLKQYSRQALNDNLSLLDEELLNEINEIVVKAGHSLLKKKEAPSLAVKVDSYALESNVHFPTDVNLLWDAARKCLKLVEQITDGGKLSGWRKHKAWFRKVKNLFTVVNRVMSRGGKNKESRLQEQVLDYLEIGGELSTKLKNSQEELQCMAAGSAVKQAKLEELSYYEKMLDKHLDLVRRRIILKESIPHKEKIFSLFEPYTRWLNKGKAGNRIELGLPIAICSDNYGFILYHQVMESEHDVEMTVPLAEKLLSRWDIYSMSFDKNFWSSPNYQKLSPQIPQLIMPKKGKLNQSEAEREVSKEFKQLRRRHAAVESDINALEHHGLNRCPDKGLPHFKRYTALGILALNLHRLGNILLERERVREKTAA